MQGEALRLVLSDLTFSKMDGEIYLAERAE